MAEEVRRDIIHHMGRRCRDWDYGGRAIYMITINLKERGRPVMAEWPRASPEKPKVYMPLTSLGEKVLSCWRRIPLFVKGALLSSSGRPKTLGDVVRGFKTGCREVGWEEGYVDNILFREGQLKRMADYIRDNPRRLAEKRANPGLFRHVADLTIDLPVSGQAQNLPVSGQAQNWPGNGRRSASARFCASAETARFCASPETAKFKAHFSAIGNAALLRWPVILQV